MSNLSLPNAWPGLLDTKAADDWEIADTEENRVWSRMQPGHDCYPYAALHIVEAVNEADVSDMREIQQALEEGDFCEAGALLRAITRDYWERQARAPRVR